MPAQSTLPRIALVVPDLSVDGGVPSVAAFLQRVITDSGRYTAELISFASSSRDGASVRLVSPASWARGIRVVEGRWRGQPYRHFGAFLTELEFQRYRPRRALTRVLDQFDLVQVVAGSPAWAMVAQRVARPVLLQAATLARAERTALLREARGPIGLWRRAMTAITSRLDSTALRHVQVVFVENDWMFAHLQRDGNCRRVVHAPPGVDCELFRPAPPRSDDFILSVARFGDPRKNVRLLFAAYGRLVQEAPRAPRLILAGKTGPSPEDWQLAHELGIVERVELRLDVGGRELGELYRNAALFVLSSDEEGLGIVLLEAMASGAPVVSTRCGGPESVVVEGETGFLTPVGDAPALAAGMRELLDDPERRRAMGQAGRRRIEQRFSLEATAGLFLEQYDEILGRSSP